MSTATDRKIRGRPGAQALLQSHHADCEANFVRLSRLLANFDAGSVASIALPRVGRRPDFVDIRVVERTPYTLLVEMSQREPAWGAGQRMMMQVRVYLDARMAEVVACQGLRQFKLRYDYPNPRMLAPDEKRQLNHFFGEWLAACLHHGHSARPLAIATGDWAHG